MRIYTYDMDNRTMHIPRVAGRLTREDTRRLLGVNLGGLALFAVVALVVSSAMFWGEEPRLLARGLIAGLVMALVLGVPSLAFLSYHIMRLSIANRDLHRSAHEDSLTQVLNRGTFGAVVDQRLDAMRDCPVTRGAFLVVDADHFKHINDRWGHTTGDHALALIAGAMRAVTQNCDMLGRLGGEEFGIFLEGTGESRSRALAESLRVAVAAIDLRSDGNERIPLSISIGGVHFVEVSTFATLYRLADQKLYEAKANGRNRVEFETMKVGTLDKSVAA